MRRISAGVGRSFFSTLRPSPMTALRIVECPSRQATLGPRGSPLRCAMYSRGLSQSLTRSSRGSTTSRGIASTRQNWSARSWGSPMTMLRLQLPVSTVVTP